MVYSKGFSCERQKIGKGVVFYGVRYGGIMNNWYLISVGRNEINHGR